MEPTDCLIEANPGSCLFALHGLCWSGVHALSSLIHQGCSFKYISRKHPCCQPRGGGKSQMSLLKYLVHHCPKINILSFRNLLWRVSKEHCFHWHRESISSSQNPQATHTFILLVLGLETRWCYSSFNVWSIKQIEYSDLKGVFACKSQCITAAVCAQGMNVIHFPWIEFIFPVFLPSSVVSSSSPTLSWRNGLSKCLFLISPLFPKLLCTAFKSLSWL